MKIKWSKNPDDDGTHDLCGKFNGKYVDVIRHGYVWSISFNGVRIKEGIIGRNAAKKEITKFLE